MREREWGGGSEGEGMGRREWEHGNMGTWERGCKKDGKGEL